MTARTRPEIPATLLTSRALTELSGASYRQVDYWRRVGLLEETIASNGSGNWAGWNAQEVRVAAALRALSVAGIAVSSSLGRGVAEHVRAHGLTGSVKSADGLLFVDVDAIADPIADG